MSALPLNAAEPLTAMFGVMLYPADADIEARNRFEALVLAPFLDKLHRQGQKIEDGLRNWVLANCGGPFALDQKDLRGRLAGGMMIGELVSVVHWFTRNRPEIASWETGVEWLEAMNVKGCTRSAIYKHRKRFVRVLHLWGAYSLSRRRIGDVQSFLALSEQIRAWGQRWRRKADKAKPLFGTDMWSPPPNWKHPDPDWPELIKIPYYELPSLGARAPKWLIG
jgi:hypothetical protein